MKNWGYPDDSVVKTGIKKLADNENNNDNNSNKLKREKSVGKLIYEQYGRQTKISHEKTW